MFISTLVIVCLIASYREGKQNEKITSLRDSISKLQPSDTPVIMSWQEYQIRRMRYLPCIYYDSTGQIVNNCGDLTKQKDN